MIERYAVRALLLTDKPSILLMKFLVPGPDRAIWVPPGGGREVGESPLECLRREIQEETGLERLEIGPLVWKRRHEYVLNGRCIKQYDDFYLINVTEFTPRVKYLEKGDERESFVEFRWWQLDKIGWSEEVFVPRNLYRYLKSLIEDGPQQRPIDVGI